MAALNNASFVLALGTIKEAGGKMKEEASPDFRSAPFPPSSFMRWGAWVGASNWRDRLFRGVCALAAMSVLVLAGLLVLVLIGRSWEAIGTIGLRFLTRTTWDPEETHRQFGALAFVYGTLATSALAMLIAVPLGVGTAAFLAEIAPRWLQRAVSFLVEMLAAIPSVVYGFWGIYVLAPHLQALTTWLGGPNTGGFGIFPAGIILSIMIVPYVTAISYDVCQAVPHSQREAALALGATRWQMIASAVLPYAGPGILGASFLALGRALGETMAVTMLIGNKPAIEWSPFALGNTIASVIANEFTEATYDLYLSALTELALVLLLVTVVVNFLARLLIRRVGRVRRQADKETRRQGARDRNHKECGSGQAPSPCLLVSSSPGTLDQSADDGRARLLRDRHRRTALLHPGLFALPRLWRAELGIIHHLAQSGG